MNATIDHEGRRRFAELSRHLAAGLITNDEFVDEIPRSRERGLLDVHFYGLWPLYDDFITHRLKDEWALTPEGRAWSPESFSSFSVWESLSRLDRGHSRGALALIYVYMYERGERDGPMDGDDGVI